MTTHSTTNSMIPTLARTAEDSKSRSPNNSLFDRLLDPEHAVPLGIAAGVVKGALVGLVTGKLMLWMTLGAIGGAVVGTLVRNAAKPTQR